MTTPQPDARAEARRDLGTLLRVALCLVPAAAIASLALGRPTAWFASAALTVAMLTALAVAAWASYRPRRRVA